MFAGSRSRNLSDTARPSTGLAAARALAHTCWAALRGAGLDVLEEPEEPPHPAAAPQHATITATVRTRPAPGTLLPAVVRLARRRGRLRRSPLHARST